MRACNELRAGIAVPQAQVDVARETSLSLKQAANLMVQAAISLFNDVDSATFEQLLDSQ
jgi:hypothetical protein